MATLTARHCAIQLDSVVHSPICWPLKRYSPKAKLVGFRQSSATPLVAIALYFYACARDKIRTFE